MKNNKCSTFLNQTRADVATRKCHINSAKINGILALQSKYFICVLILPPLSLWFSRTRERYMKFVKPETKELNPTTCIKIIKICDYQGWLSPCKLNAWISASVKWKIFHTRKWQLILVTKFDFNEYLHTRRHVLLTNWQIIFIIFISF